MDPIVGEGFVNQDLFQTDDAGNLYFIEFLASHFETQRPQTQRIVRVDVSNPSKLVRQYMTPMSEDVIEFAVGSDGLILYSARAPNRDVKRFVFPNGSIKEFPEHLPQQGIQYWKGSSELFFDEDGEISTLMVNGNEIEKVSYGITEDLIGIPSVLGTSKLEFPGHFMMITDTSVWEVENPQNKPGRLDIPLDRFFGFASAKDFYFIAGENSLGTNIVRVDPVNNRMKELLPAGAYELGQMDVIGDGRVRFTALELGDAPVEVEGVIQVDGTIIFTSQVPFDGEVRALIRL